jgi:cytidylate kinase
MSKKPFIIAISGKSGCGNSTVSRLLSQRLKIGFVNYTLRNLAEEQGISLPEMLERAKSDTSIDRSLDSRQVELARKADCVIGSRLAVWLLPDADLKVYLGASGITRANRIHKREGGNAEENLELTRKRDSCDRERYRSLYGIDNDDYGFVDIIINTERLDPEAIVESLCALALAIHPNET